MLLVVDGTKDNFPLCFILVAAVPVDENAMAGQNIKHNNNDAHDGLLFSDDDS